jgi:hypothetical protein
VKRSGRDEPMSVEIHMCMETTQGISLYSYLYLKLINHYFSLIIFYVFSSTKLKNKKTEQVLPRSKRWGMGEVAQIMHTCVSKCRNDKIKK